LQILRLAAEGDSAPQIAIQLVLAPSTVKTHLHNIYNQLGVSDRSAAVAHVLRTGRIQ
jgi:two-component system, NarL family, nitrate/nitrite response regulator NarL